VGNGGFAVAHANITYQTQRPVRTKPVGTLRFAHPTSSPFVLAQAGTQSLALDSRLRGNERVLLAVSQFTAARGRMP
jgi:hypothetical protein